MYAGTTGYWEPGTLLSCLVKVTSFQQSQYGEYDLLLLGSRNSYAGL